MTMSAVPATTGATRSGMRSCGYWLSPSVLTRMSAPSSSARCAPSWNERPRPRLPACRTNWVTPCARATSTVPSVEPSSITRTMISSMPGMRSGIDRRTAGSVSSSFRQGIWTTSLTALPPPRARGRWYRDRRSHPLTLVRREGTSRTREAGGARMTRSQPASWSALAVPATFVVVNVLSYALLLAAAHLLPKSAYGALSSLLGVLLISTIPMLALQTVAARRAAAGAGSAGLVRGTTVVGAGVTLVLVVASPALSAFLHLSGVLGVLLVAASVPGGAVLGTAMGIAQGRRRFGRLAVLIA